MTAARRARWPWIVFIAVVAAMLIAAASFVPSRSPRRCLLRLCGSTCRPRSLLGGSHAPADSDASARKFRAVREHPRRSREPRRRRSVRPIGSVAKAMTALVVLDALPLAPGANRAVADDDRRGRARCTGRRSPQADRIFRCAPARCFTERDLLLALLLPSADNIAESLAVWVSGNRTAFIARLNATAAAMGMAHTHFADPSGLSIKTVPQLADLVLLAKAVIANPALAELVAVQQVRLPDGTVLHNLDILLGKERLARHQDRLDRRSRRVPALCRAQVVRHTARRVTDRMGRRPRSAAGARHRSGSPRARCRRLQPARAPSSTVLGSYSAVDLSDAMPAVTGTIATAWGDTAQLQSLANAGQ